MLIDFGNFLNIHRICNEIVWTQFCWHLMSLMTCMHHICVFYSIEILRYFCGLADPGDTLHPCTDDLLCKM